MYLENMTYPFNWRQTGSQNLINPVLRGAFHPASTFDWQVEAAQEEESPHQLETSYFRKLRMVLHDALDIPRR